MAGGGAQAGAIFPLGHHLGIRGWPVVEPRDTDAAFLIVVKTRRTREMWIGTMQKTLSKKRWALLPLRSAEDEKPMPPLRIREEARRPKAEGSHELPRRVGLCTQRRGRGILRTSPIKSSQKFGAHPCFAVGYDVSVT